MLPLFQIVTPNSPLKKIMSYNDIPSKPRRKKVDVPIHKPHYDADKTKLKKTYSANFSKKNKHKHGDNELQQYHTEVVVEIPETDSTSKHSRKQLNKEIDKLVSENNELILKFNELEELSIKKITKLKEKISSLQNTNLNFTKENETLREQSYNLLAVYEELQNEMELKKVCKNCQELRNNIEQLSEENSKLQIKNKELSEDLSMLKTVVYRLNLQLERYQEKLRTHNLKVPSETHLTNAANKNVIGANVDKLSAGHRNHNHTPISWGSVNSHTLGPLLDAFQDTIREKEELIENYETELTTFTGKMKEVIEENESLYKKLTEDENCSLRLGAELESLKKELKITRDQNDALIKKCAIKQDKIEEILKIYENKVGQMKRDYNLVHEEYVKCKTENAALIEKNRSLVDAQDDFRNERSNYIPVSIHTASVNECKKWYEELKLQYENEKHKLNKNIEAQTKLISDLNNQINSEHKIKEDLESKIHHLEKHIKKLEAKHLDLEHALNEVQVSRSACRKQLHKAMGFAKDMVAEQETLLKALNQRQLENKAVKKIGSEMAVRMDSLKNQLKDVQKSAWQEFTTVEEKIQEQADIIETMKEEHQKEIDKLQMLIKQKTTVVESDNIPLPHYLLFKEKHKS